MDTSVVVAHFRRDDSVAIRLQGYASIYLPAIALGELYHGAYRSAHRDKQLEQFARFRAAVTILRVDAGTAKIYGKIRTALAEAGKPIPENDIWIAALARQHELPLACRDHHFSEIAGLDLRAW